METIILIIFFISIILLIPTILMQSGSGADAGMFGTDLTMGAFGAKTSEVLVKFTGWLVVIFLTSAFLYGYIKVKENKVVVPTRSNQLHSQPAPKTKPATQKPALPETPNSSMPEKPLTLPQPK